MKHPSGATAKEPPIEIFGADTPPEHCMAHSTTSLFGSFAGPISHLHLDSRALAESPTSSHDSPFRIPDAIFEKGGFARLGWPMICCDANWLSGYICERSGLHPTHRRKYFMRTPRKSSSAFARLSFPSQYCACDCRWHQISYLTITRVCVLLSDISNLNVCSKAHPENPGHRLM